MRIIFQTYELSAGGKGSPVGLSVGGQKQIDTLSFLRATEGKVFDRGNKLYRLSWEQRREFATAGQAESFMLLHAANVPDGVGDCVITTEGSASVTLTGAVLQIPQAERQVGTNTFHRYELIASGMTGTVPTPMDPIANGGGGPSVPADAVTHNGQPVTHGGEYVTAA